MIDQSTLLLQLLTEIELQSPIEFGNLPFDDEDLKSRAVAGTVEMLEKLQALPAETVQLILAATLAHQVLENLVLNLQKLIANAGVDEKSIILTDLMASLRKPR